MTRAEMSIWPLRTPCRAQVGSAWCRLCQDSPKDGIASHQTLRDRSRTVKFSSPMVWQIELTDHVTWCRSAIRTRLPQKNAVHAPHHDMVTRPPMSGGVSSEMSTKTQK